MYIVHCSYTLTDGHTAAAAAGNLKPLFFCLLSMYMYMYMCACSFFAICSVHLHVCI